MRRLPALVSQLTLVALLAVAAPVGLLGGAAPAQARDGAVTNVRPPGVKGEAVFGGLLKAGPGGWDPADVELGYRWKRDGAFVPGARDRTYRLGSADLGHRLSVQVRATDPASGDTATATSQESAAVERATYSLTGVPRVKGVLRYTHRVSVDGSSFRPAPKRLRYQWLRAGKPIPGATRAGYTFAPQDVGRRIRVRVTASGPGYRTVSATSSRQGTVKHRVDVRRRVTYSVVTRGKITTSVKKFARLAQQTYDDPRGWRAKGVSFSRVAQGGSFTLVLAEARTVPSFSSECSATYSCRVGRYVIINQTRWKTASPAWNKGGRSLRDYRHLVVNHETGHWLGKGHASCPRPGALAPVMAQQSKGTGGCRLNPWPTPAELR